MENMKYKILSQHESSKLTEEVQKHINEGWDPLGGVAVAAVLVDEIPAPLFVQAIIKAG
ncbi:MAG TPA: hypothetical protein DCZ95_13160 [Verrucomicrobia bacterium]|nr:hypothetical protein [Verrucomicrobiota bacterium]